MVLSLERIKIEINLLVVRVKITTEQQLHLVVFYSLACSPIKLINQRDPECKK